VLRSLTAATLLAGVVMAPIARADDTCIPAYEETQSLRKDGHLVAARDRAIVCAKNTCPNALTKDCTRWLEELDESIPSIVPRALAADGTDYVDVAVRMDGQPLAQKLDGRAILVDPGSHQLVFTMEGAAPLEMAVVVHEGEKSRPITATLTLTAPVSTPSRPIPPAAYVAGSIGLVAIGFGSYFGIQGLSDKGTLDGCKPHCDPSAVDSMMHSLAAADVAFAIGGVAILTTLYVVLTRPTVMRPTPAALLLRGQF
jgi:hypothetical protein